MGMPIITPSQTSRCQAVSDIIQSVALEQAALSHILNAEGEKLQKILKDDRICTETLLKTNKSIQSMVQSITMLEVVLQSKLAMFEDCICEPCRKDEHCG